MCAACWREVPKHLQREVHRTWRQWRKNFGSEDAMAAYNDAAEAAIGAVS